MSKRLNISPDLSLPLDAATETFGIMGRRGSGKSHTGSVMAEEMLGHGIPVIAYDPTGAWYGLKSSIDGKSAGYPVVIFGGEHEDVPLAETDGEMVARAIVAERFPAILDCSLLRKGARLRFMAEFLETLYHHNREAVHLFADEIHTIAPLQLRNVGDANVYQSRCVGALEDIILQGRRRGIGMTGMTQRPALVNANVRSQFGTLIAMQIVAPLDRKAIGDWIAEKGTEEEGERLLEQLPRLERGTGIVWSPTFDLLKSVKFRARTTFDSGRTPGVGERRVEPKVWAKIDVEKLGQTIAARREEKKANDPVALKGRVAALERELKASLAAPKGTATSQQIRDAHQQTKANAATIARLKKGLEDAMKVIAEINAKGFEKTDIDPDLVRKAVEAAAQQIVKAAEQRLATREREFSEWKRKASKLLGDLQKLIGDDVKVSVDVQHNEPFTVSGKAAETTSDEYDGDADQDAAADDGEGSGGGGTLEQRILDALAWWEAASVNQPTREQVAFVAKVRPTGGYYARTVGELKTSGLVEYPDKGRIRLTSEGRAKANVPAQRPDRAELIKRARAVVPAGMPRTLFNTIVQAGKPMSRDELAAANSIDASGGYFARIVGNMKTGGIITYPGKGMVALGPAFQMRGE